MVTSRDANLRDLIGRTIVGVSITKRPTNAGPRNNIDYLVLDNGRKLYFSVGETDPAKTGGAYVVVPRTFTKPGAKRRGE